MSNSLNERVISLHRAVGRIVLKTMTDFEATLATTDLYRPARRKTACARSVFAYLFLCCICLCSTYPSSVRSAVPKGWVTLKTEPYSKKRDDLIFMNSETGIYGTGDGRLYRTTDAGNSWSLAWNHPGTFIRSFGFIDEKHGFLGNLGTDLIDRITDSTPLYETTDGGITWSPVAGLSNHEIAGVCAIDVVSASSIVEGEIRKRTLIFAAGRANGPGKLVRSDDLGKTWVSVALPEEVGMILDVKFLDPNNGLLFAGTNSDVAKSNAAVLRTSDGGMNWREVFRSTRSSEIIWKSSFPTNRVGYATIQRNDDSSPQQRIIKSTDAGEHWEEIPLVADSRAQEFGIGFLDSDHGWVGTAVGGFETRDGGKSWSASSLAPKANKIRTHSVDGDEMLYSIGTEAQRYLPNNSSQSH